MTTNDILKFYDEYIIKESKLRSEYEFKVLVTFDVYINDKCKDEEKYNDDNLKILEISNVKQMLNPTLLQ